MTRRRAIAAVIALLAFAAFLPALANGFVAYDDPLYLTANPVVQRGLSWHGLAWAMTAFRTGHWHPLTWLSLMLDWQLFGAHAWGHHLVGLALHAAVAAMVFLWLEECTGDWLRAAIVAALFAVHPMRVESVVWASERKDVLSALFFVAACWAHTRRARTAVTAFTALSLLCKPMAVTMPLVLLLLDRWPLERKERLTALVFEKAPLFVLSAGASVMAMIAQTAGGAVGQHTRTSAVLAQAAVNPLLYLKLTLWPAHLIPLYPLPEVAPSLWAAMAALALLALLTAAAFFAGKAVSTGWAWFLVTLLPVVGLVQVGWQSVADRYMYLPHIGLFLAFVWAVPRWRPAYAAALAGFLGGLAWVQTGYWKSTEALFAHVREVSPDNALGNIEAGDEALRAGRLDEAARSFMAALRRQPGSASAMEGLATVLERQGRGEEAIAMLARAVRAEPSLPGLAQHYASALANHGRYREALAEYQRIFALEPDRPGVALGLGAVLGQLGRGDEAIAMFRRAVRQSPDDAGPHEALGIALARAGDYAAAIPELERALAIAPGFPRAREVLRAAREDAAKAKGPRAAGLSRE